MIVCDVLVNDINTKYLEKPQNFKQKLNLYFQIDTIAEIFLIMFTGNKRGFLKSAESLDLNVPFLSLFVVDFSLIKTKQTNRENCVNTKLRNKHIKSTNSECQSMNGRRKVVVHKFANWQELL